MEKEANENDKERSSVAKPASGRCRLRSSPPTPFLPPTIPSPTFCLSSMESSFCFQKLDSKPSATLRVNEMAKHAAAQGRQIAHLGFGESDVPVAGWLHQAYRESIDATYYPSFRGSPDLRKQIASFEQHNLDQSAQALRRDSPTTFLADNVVVCPGSKPALFALLALLPGDLILPNPSWPPYAIQAHLGQKQAIYLETSRNDLPDGSSSHEIQLETLQDTYQRALERGAKPGILLLNSPNSPTGRMLDPTNVAKICQFARERSLLILSDEIYSGIIFPSFLQPSSTSDLLPKGCVTPPTHASPALFYPEGTIITSGMSKLFAVGGWRLGYAILPDTPLGSQLAEKLAAFASECWSSAPAPVALAAEYTYSLINRERKQEFDHKALSGSPIRGLFQTYADATALLHGFATHRIYSVLRRFHVAVPPPQAAFYLYPDFSAYAPRLQQKHGISTSEQLATWLMESYGLATVPGTEMGDHPSRLCLRLATSLLLFRDRNDKKDRGAHLLARAEFLAQMSASELSTETLQNQLSLPPLDQAISLLENVILPEITARTNAPTPTPASMANI